MLDNAGLKDLVSKKWRRPLRSGKRSRISRRRWGSASDGRLLSLELIARACGIVRAIAKAHGADDLVNFGEQDLKAEVKALTGGKCVDVIYDPVGDSLADPAFRTIAWGGRYLVIGFAGGEIPAIPFDLPLVKGASIVGMFFGDFLARTPALHRANMAELCAMHANGSLEPLISARYPLSEGAAAIRFTMDRKAIGKVLVIGMAG